MCIYLIAYEDGASAAGSNGRCMDVSEGRVKLMGASSTVDLQCKLVNAF